MRVLITGATGFIGRALCPALVATGHEVAVVVRNSDNPTIPERATVHVIPNIGPETEWDQALSGIDAVIHLAARAHVMEEHARDPLAEFSRINAEGTGRLVSAAAKAGIGRFVYLSTVKVMGDRSPAPFRETDTPRPEDDYGKSKLAGERALAEAAADTGLEPIILRPPLVYGPGAKGNFLALMKFCQAALPLPFSAVDNRRSIIYLGNLVDAIGRCLTADGAAGETYFVRDDEDVSTPGLVRNVAEALGRPARLFPAPRGVLRLAGAITGKTQAISTLLSDLQVDDEKIRRQLRWTPSLNMLQGLKETAAWFSAGG